VADNQWQKQYELSKKASSSSGSSRSSGSSSKSASSGGLNVNDNSNQLQSNNTVQNITIDDVVKNLKFVQGANVNKSIYDSYSGKYFSSPEEAIKYWQG